MQSAEVLDNVGQFADAIFAQKIGQPYRQMVIFNDLLNQIVVEDGPRAAIFGAVMLKVFNQLFRNDVCSAARLTRNRQCAAPRRGDSGNGFF